MIVLPVVIMLIPISVLAEEPVPSKDEFVALLKSHETAIESIQGKVKCFGGLKDRKGLEDWPQETPLGEYEFRFSPPMERMWISGFHRSLNRGGIPESSVLESDRFIRRPWELGVSNGKSVTFRLQGRSGLIESEGLQDTALPFLSPWSLMGWNVDSRLHNIPISQLLEKLDVELEKLSWSRDFGEEKVLVAEFGIGERNERLAPGRFPSHKIDVYFNMKKSMRPVKIVNYDDRIGLLRESIDRIQLSEVAEGIWIPTRGRLTHYSAPELEFDPVVAGDVDAFLAMSREERWNFFKKKSSSKPLSITLMEAEVEINRNLAEEDFTIVFPPGTKVWDDILKERYIVE